MEDVDLRHAKEHLEELVARATRGEEVCIVHPKGDAVRLVPARVGRQNPPAANPKRRPGRWADHLPPPPEDFFDPLSEEELKLWYGDSA